MILGKTAAPATDALTIIGALDDIPDPWVKQTPNNKRKSEYLKRLASRLAEKRN